MAGTPQDPFLETAARCDVCLDLKRAHLRRQWRKFGRLGPFDVPYRLTVKKLNQTAEDYGCEGCLLIQRAVQAIHGELAEELEKALATSGGKPVEPMEPVQFRNLRLEYLDADDLGRLSLSLSALHPKDVTEAMWNFATWHKDIKTELYTAPSQADPDRPREHRVSTPEYEIYTTFNGTLTDADDYPHWDSIQKRTPQSRNTWSDDAVRWVLSKLDECREGHTLCDLSREHPVLPTRVIDVGENFWDYKADVKLMVTEGGRGEYLCLSHCWGTPDVAPLETTRANFDAHQRAISYRALPSTFRHAIVFARKLHVRYLWIDSLCIIQNDAEDWLKEAGQMADIYQNAKLTLAAAASENSRGGLFRACNPGTRLDGGDGTDPGAAGGIFLRRFSDPAFFKQRSAKDPHGADLVSPLLKRAWVFQERVLSRRVLYFTPLELVLECREATYTESGHDWVDSSVKRRFNAVYSKETPPNAISATWRSLVQDFTALALTRVTDTLPAMAGLAHAVFDGRGPGQHYLAGLWRDSFLSDLLWRRSRNMEGPIRQNTNIPTWSWARTDAPKEYPHAALLSELCSMVDAQCVADDGEGSNFLRIESGHAIISGYLLPATLTGMGVTVEGIPRVAHRAEPDYHWENPPEGVDSAGQIKIGDRLYLLPLVACEGSEEYRVDLQCLILTRQTNDVFRRVGIMDVSLANLLTYHYILEDKEFLVEAIRDHIHLGEELLGDDGLYRREKEGSRGPIWDRTEEQQRRRQHEVVASFLHLCEYGDRREEMPFEKFYGSPHLALLRKQLSEEEARVAEWRRRHESGEDQSHGRQNIKIV